MCLHTAILVLHTEIREHYLWLVQNFWSISITEINNLIEPNVLFSIKYVE